MTGIIGYACKTGLGVMTRQFRNHLGIGKQLVIPNSDWPLVREWCHGQHFSPTWEVQWDDLQSWVREEGISTTVLIETPFGENTIRRLKHLGVRVVFVPMWEWFDSRDDRFHGADVYVCTSVKCYEEIPFPQKILIPNPIDSESFKFREIGPKAKTFVHNAGTGGINGRKGTWEAIQGFMLAEVDAELIVRAQKPLEDIMPLVPKLPGNVRVEIGTKETCEELYDEGDVLIYCSRYDGQAMVSQEGMAAGMAVITTDAAPMNEYWISDDERLLASVGNKIPAGTLNPSTESNIVDLNDLSEKIRWCCENDIREIGKRNREKIERNYSWKVLRPRLLDVLW